MKAEIINDGIQQEINYKFWKSLYKNKTFSLDKLNITLPIDIENPYITESFELCIEHYHQKNKVKRYISPIKGSNNTDNMIGRFTLDNKKLLTDLNPTRKYENALLCNINVIPKKISLTNVIESMFLGNSTLSINTSSGEKSTEIKLDNILVGYENNNLYFKDKNTQKNIIFRDKNMLNEQLKNPLIDLLLRYSHPRFSTIHNYPWSYMDNQMVFYPEIKYKDIVVEPQRIRIYKDLLNLTSFKSFKKNINTLLEDVECNETLYFIMADNKIPYINSDLSLNSLYKAIKKSKLEYAEFIDLPDHQECDESYELIYNFSFDKDDRKIINNNNKKLWTHNNNRLMDPSQGWLYFKILFAKNEIDYFIKHYYHFNSSYFALKRRISFQWKVIPNETKRILDYLCKKAITSFGGRDWEVWYSPDIPVHDGPYVFGQLPGLILEVKSADGEYHYQAIGLQEERKDIIIEKKVAWVKDREHLIRLKKDYIKSPSATARQEDLQYGISGAVVNGQKIDLEEGYRLLDRELWDWMEENNNSIEKDDIWVR